MCKITITSPQVHNLGFEWKVESNERRESEREWERKEKGRGTERRKENWKESLGRNGINCQMHQPWFEPCAYKRTLSVPFFSPFNLLLKIVPLRIHPTINLWCDLLFRCIRVPSWIRSHGSTSFWTSNRNDKSSTETSFWENRHSATKGGGARIAAQHSYKATEPDSVGEEVQCERAEQGQRNRANPRDLHVGWTRRATTM